ncbi:MAG: hypothetical protein PHW46_02850 [Candidatus Omnitrophica bacterium]|nr:hypothetical protein [Candidatus Omnitrophota bacterium]
MTLSANRKLIREIEDALSAKVPIHLGVNKEYQLVRLVYEICKNKNLTSKEAFDLINIDNLVDQGKGKLFVRIKEALFCVRYPSLLSGDDVRLMPFIKSHVDRECTSWDLTIKPKRIFLQKEAKGYKWTSDFLANFVRTEIIEIKDLKEGFNHLAEKDPITLYNERRENVFIVKNKTAFIKKCPCTKNVKKCNYWILNIGFGCPMDCSYCYLEMYSNSPGLIFTANIEDYYQEIEELNNKLTGRIRIGTGEFTDSLYLDKFTKYSSYLVPFFKDKDKLILELKTKTVNIENVLKEPSHKNCVVSWSMNTRSMASKYERGGAPIEDRINAARQVAKKGFKIGFHFDPLIFYEAWRKEYQELVEEIFSFDEIKENVEWISLGALRYTPGLKEIAETRFADNDLYYAGEFFTGADGKLRYPEKLRIEMYNNMIDRIRKFNKTCWIYLCMEPEEVWKETLLSKSDHQRCFGL